jgi:membrane protease YdiL (CAAX protease family)
MDGRRLRGRTAALLPVLAALLFGPLLAWHRLGPLDFWWGMSLSVAMLIGLGFLTDDSQRSSLLQDLKKGWPQKISWGVLSALLLYGVFWVGSAASRAVLPRAAKEIGAVYGFKQDAAVIRIVVLIVFVIGPGEEIFWRGFLQHRWEKRLGLPTGWLLASGFYAAVHAGSGNLLLVLSALICGLFWGALYARFRSVVLVAISHTIWDILIFILFPLA